MIDPRDWHDAPARKNLEFDQWYWPRAGFAVFVAFTVICAACMPSKGKKTDTLLQVSPRQDEALPDATLADGRRFIPPSPEPWQAKPKGKPPACKKGQHAINGACWYRANPEDFSPPCGEPTFEHKGTCYHAVAEPTRQPSSVSQ